MIATKTRESELWEALKEVNKKFSNNVDFHTLERRKGKLNFRLKTISNKEPGHTKGYPISYQNPKYDSFVNAVKEANGLPTEPFQLVRQSNYSWACWHVHGYFFDCLFKINPNAKVYSSGKAITKDNGNWDDWKVGRGLMKSDLCGCKEEKLI